jgi:ABC-type multidrug transport system fused ATPase/permease subunit
VTPDPAPRGRPALTRLLRASMRPYAGQVTAIVVLTAVQCAGNLYLPVLNAAIINTGVLQADAGYIWRAGGVMLAISAVVSVLTVVTVYWAARVAAAVGGDLRLAVYRRVQAFSAREIGRFGVPTLVTRNVNDVQQVQLFVQLGLFLLVSSVVMILGALILAVREGPLLSLLLLGVVPLLLIVADEAFRTLVPMSRSLQAQVDRLTQVLREQIGGTRVIRAFRRTRHEADRFRRANAALTATSVRISRIVAVLFPVAGAVTSLAAVAVVWFGGRLVSEGSMPVGNLIPVLLYVSQILTNLVIGLLVVILLPRAAASAERIVAVLRTAPAITDPPRPVRPPAVTGALEFRRVSFGYPGSERPVLSDLTFSVRPGQACAVIGGTGAGKTTVVSLALRILEVSGGAVLVNGIDVRLQAAAQLRAAAGLVPQSAFLFAGTVASNLRFGRTDASDDELWHALEVAQASDFVSALPGGLDAPIHQGGVNVSGGQRQRLCIARALVRRPSLYLFDDCFSALDPGTDARLRAALRAETGDAAVLIVSQRVSTIMDADQIVVLDAGEVAGAGTHRELLAGCAPYQEIVESQLGAGAAA